jgi:hypothetical protein
MLDALLVSARRLIELIAHGRGTEQPARHAASSEANSLSRL